MMRRYRLGHELPNAFVKRALSNEVGPRVADAFKIERGPFSENGGGIKIYLNASIRHASCLRSRRSYCQPPRRRAGCRFEAGAVRGHGPARIWLRNPKLQKPAPDRLFPRLPV